MYLVIKYSFRKLAQSGQFFHQDTNLRSRVYDVVISEDLEESEPSVYLNDIYHEYASEYYPEVILLGKK